MTPERPTVAASSRRAGVHGRLQRQADEHDRQQAACLGKGLAEGRQSADWPLLLAGTGRNDVAPPQRFDSWEGRVIWPQRQAAGLSPAR
jgi:hypothetical protein